MFRTSEVHERNQHQYILKCKDPFEHHLSFRSANFCPDFQAGYQLLNQHFPIEVLFVSKCFTCIYVWYMCLWCICMHVYVCVCSDVWECTCVLLALFLIHRVQVSQLTSKHANWIVLLASLFWGSPASVSWVPWVPHPPSVFLCIPKIQTLIFRLARSHKEY